MQKDSSTNLINVHDKVFLILTLDTITRNSTKKSFYDTIINL